MSLEFNGYNRTVLQDIIESTLLTKLDVNRYMTRDDQLAVEAGMIKKIHRYKGTGTAEDLERGAKNTGLIDAQYTEEAYEIHRTQATTKWYDDDQMNDPAYIDTKVRALAESMVNKWTQDAFVEYNKTGKTAVMSSYNLAEFADAIAQYANKYEDQSGLFFLCDVALVPKIRKMLGDELRYVEDYIRTGAIGAVLGVPIYTSKAVPKGMMFLAHPEAVHAFIKRDTTVEQSRDIESKENTVVASKYAVIALVDENKCIKCGKEQATAATITTSTAAGTTVAGAATTGAKVTCYVNGTKSGNVATASSNAYSITVDEALAAEDEVKVVAELEGFLPSIAEVTVA